MIRVTADPARRRINVVMGDMLTVEEIRAFSDEEQAAARGMGLASGEFDLLIVTIGNHVQTQVAMNEFKRLLMESPLKARRIATVRDGVLTRMQTKRISSVRANAEVFDSIGEAEAWLDAPDQPVE